MDKQSVHTEFMPVCWDSLIKEYALTQEQIVQLKRYAQLLIEWNAKFNLTTINDEAAIVQHHFQDSLAIIDSIDFAQVRSLCDVGTGAGFPGLPLKIKFPHLMVVLIEVNNKKRLFLEHVVNELKLDNVIISPLDWLTFLRTTEYALDYVFARASLQPEELVRMFKPGCHYKNAVLVYWASWQWEPISLRTDYKEIPYVVGDIQRKYVFFKAS